MKAFIIKPEIQMVGFDKFCCSRWGNVLLLVVALLLSACNSGSTDQPSSPEVEKQGATNSESPDQPPPVETEKEDSISNDSSSSSQPPASKTEGGGTTNNNLPGQPSIPEEKDTDPTPLPAAPSVVHFSYTTSDVIFPNPERGFFGVSTLLTDRIEKGDFDDDVENGRTLTNSTIHLDNYRDSELPESLLTDLEAGLESLRHSKGIKAILRFSYNSCFNCPDARKEIVLTHINQLKPVLRKYSDVIAFIPVGFIGSWGEWHHSTNNLLNEQDRKDIVTALLDALPKSRMVLIRYPFRKQDIFEEVNEQSAFSGTYTARIGHHNDCFLALLTADEGYLPDNNATAAEIQLMKDYIRRESLYTPVGGETCEMGRRDDGLIEMKNLRWTFINAYYFKGLLDYWKQTGAYRIMQRKLGYRFVLLDGQITANTKADNSIELQLDLRNDGWANPYNPRPVYLVIEGSDERLDFMLKDADPRWWQPGKQITLSSRISLPREMKGGEYTIALWLPDESQYLRNNPSFSIRFANEGVWDESKGYNILGRTQIYSDASGTKVFPITRSSQQPE